MQHSDVTGPPVLVPHGHDAYFPGDEANPGRLGAALLPGGPWPRFQLILEKTFLFFLLYLSKSSERGQLS